MFACVIVKRITYCLAYTVIVIDFRMLRWCQSQLLIDSVQQQIVFLSLNIVYNVNIEVEKWEITEGYNLPYVPNYTVM